MRVAVEPCQIDAGPVRRELTGNVDVVARLETINAGGGVATMATLGVRSRSLNRSLAWMFRLNQARERTPANRRERRSESTSWGSLVRAQYRPSGKPPETAAFCFQGENVAAFVLPKCDHSL
jgi:hypothetical protein